MLLHFLTCCCTRFLAVKHSRIGSVPLKVTPSYYRNFLNFSWDWWISNKIFFVTSSFHFRDPNAKSVFLAVHKGSWHLTNQWLVGDGHWNTCLWKVLYLKSAMKIVTFYFRQQQSLLRLRWSDSHWDATSRTEQCHPRDRGVSPLGLWCSFPRNCHLPERWGNFMNNSVRSPPPLLE